MCAALAVASGQPMAMLVDMLHDDYRLFDSMWYMAFSQDGDEVPS